MFSSGFEGYEEYFSNVHNMNDDSDTMEAFATIAPTIVSTRDGDPETPFVTSLAFHLDILLVFVGVVFMILVRVWLEFLNKNANGDVVMAQLEPEEERDIQKLSIEDWASLYHKTFRSNPHRVELTDEHISSIKTEDDGEGERDESHKNGENAQDIESGRDSEKSTRHNDPPSSCVRILEALTGRNHAKTTIPPLGGTCVICIEDFKAGDEVVWSSFNPHTAEDDGISAHDDHGCQHVYHQECMVQYLANHSHRMFRKQHQQDIETPCPTCRRDFCTIAQEDLSVAIQARCLALEETSSSSGASSEDGEEISSSISESEPAAQV